MEQGPGAGWEHSLATGAFLSPFWRPGFASLLYSPKGIIQGASAQLVLSCPLFTGVRFDVLFSRALGLLHYSSSCKVVDAEG